MSISQFTPSPTALRPRDATSSASYDANGNLICPTDTAKCPVCPDNQECYQQARTSTSCAKYVCVPKTPQSASSVSVGGIVGGVVGGIVVIAALAFVYYKFVYRKKHPRVSEMAMDEMDADATFLATNGDDSPLGEKVDRPQALRTGLANSVTKNRRLLAYESFMRPQARYTKRPSVASSTEGSRSGSGTSTTDVRGHLRGGMDGYVNSDQSKRNSVATTISTTNASNILPIAYIPGVTIRPSKNNTRSIYSYETDLIFSDMNAIENASIVAERGANQKATMTAIRAQPKLVKVARIDEDDELEEDDDDGVDDGVDNGVDDTNVTSVDDVTNSTWDAKDLSVVTALYTVNTLSINVHGGDDSEPDSDVDSDIVEIGRATSTRHARRVVGGGDSSGADGDRDDQQLGSIVLDIEGPDHRP